MRQVFLTANFLQNGAANLPRSEFADKNVSHGHVAGEPSYWSCRGKRFGLGHSRCVVVDTSGPGSPPCPPPELVGFRGFWPLGFGRLSRLARVMPTIVAYSAFAVAFLAVCIAVVNSVDS